MIWMFDGSRDGSDEYLSFHTQAHISTAMCPHYAELFITAIRMHFQLSGGCLVHLQTK